jgi:steroid delta-isomerase-like uncharacterized protein
VTRAEVVALFERRETAWRKRDAAALAADHSPDGVVISPTGGVLEGRTGIAHIYQVWFTAFPDLAFSTEDLIVDDDRVALLWRVAGTHLGEFFGVNPTKRHIEISGASIYRLQNGLIVHERRVLDFTGVLLQVGVLRAKPA